MRTLAAVLLTCILAGAAPAAQPGWYVVRKGDTLGLVARRFGCAAADLARDNKLAGSVIHVGQKLRLERPFQRTRAADVKFRRPFSKRGRILETYGNHRRGKTVVPRSGTKMACPLGSQVTSPAPAVVRYVGRMDEFGTFVILEHGGGYHTVLAPLDRDRLRCEVGQALLAGDEIGVTAPPPRQDQEPYLHLELRRDERTVDPSRLLR